MVRLTLLVSLVCLTSIALGYPMDDDLETALEHHHDHSHHDDTSDSSEERHHTVDSSDDFSDDSHHHLSQGIDLTNGTCLDKAERVLKYFWERYKARFGIKVSPKQEARSCRLFCLRQIRKDSGVKTKANKRLWWNEQSFQNRHKLGYSFNRGKAIFKKAFDRIQFHNMEANLGLHSFRQGLNSLSCLSEEEMEQRKGLKVDHNRNSVNEHRASYVPVGATAPNSIDWRTKGWVTGVKDQGQCGSCYSFSATGALEGQLYNKTNKLIPLSEQNIIDCSTSQGNQGCNGGTVNNAFAYVKKNNGINKEASYPYEAKLGTCRYLRANDAGATVSNWVNVKPGNEESLQAAVGLIGPTSVAIDSSQPGFQGYHTGIFKCKNRVSIDHAVLVVGYTSEYWIVKNSWGTSWGEQGYIKIARGDGQCNCGITQQASVPLS